MRVYFIAHGNDKVGMGHIMRTISLAEAFRECGHDVSFFSRYKQGLDIITNKGFDVKKLPEPNGDVKRSGFFYGRQEELERDPDVIHDGLTERTDLIVLDSYNVTSLYLKKLRNLTKCLAYIDDLNAFSYPVDILINGTASADEMRYKEKQEAKLLLGVKYNLLRKEFKEINKRETKMSISDIIITTGNSDPFHMTEKLLKYLMYDRSFRTYQYHVIVGAGFEKNIWMDKEIAENRRIFLYDNPSNMPEIMLKCDMAVTAGGSTLYELAACGVPAVVFAYADNQLVQIKALEKKGLLRYLGKYSEVDGHSLLENAVYLKEHLEYRKGMIKQLQVLVDGNGAYRIVKEVEGWMMGQEKYMRFKKLD